MPSWRLSLPEAEIVSDYIFIRIGSEELPRASLKKISLIYAALKGKIGSNRGLK